MRVQVQVTTEELLAKVGRLVVELEATQVVLDRCVAVMSPEQRTEAGIAAQEPSAAMPAWDGRPPEMPGPNGAGPVLVGSVVPGGAVEDDG